MHYFFPDQKPLYYKASSAHFNKPFKLVFVSNRLAKFIATTGSDKGWMYQFIGIETVVLDSDYQWIAVNSAGTGICIKYFKQW